eukprot:Em0630g4a
MESRPQHLSESEGLDTISPDPVETASDLVRNLSFPSASPRAVKKTWKVAALKTRALPDPWAGFQLDAIPEERAIRHMYDPRTGRWRQDEVVVKMQSERFAHGAMRECFRMKKLSKFSQHPDWHNASNYVAKCYMKPVERRVYFEDVKLQMDSKLWGELYNNCDPPKKVDFFQTYIIEMKDRVDTPLYCVEHLIEGNYIKYNSNSGFVSEVNRLTPQAFSHFTFEKSNHSLIVVDIQGVGDLYTDPQMHTTNLDKDYGDGNLGPKGMALFFSSHFCSSLCGKLGLTQFDLSPKELGKLKAGRTSGSPATTCITRFKDPAHHGASNHTHRATGGIEFNTGLPADEGQTQMKPWELLGNGKLLSASVAKEVARLERQDLGELHTLGMVHFELAHYHETGRLSEDQKPDWECAQYHLGKAADCRTVEAMCTLGQVLCQLPHQQFPALKIEPSPTHSYVGMGYLELAAKAGVREAMLHVASAYDTGIGLGNSPDGSQERSQDWVRATHWYTQALATQENGDQRLDAESDYALLARLAEMYRSGGHGLVKDCHKAGEYYNEAAEAATAAMKGRLASRYYTLAEEASADAE